MRDWIDQLSFRARVSIIIVVFVLTMLAMMDNSGNCLRISARLFSKQPSVRHGGERFAPPFNRLIKQIANRSSPCSKMLISSLWPSKAAMSRLSAAIAANGYRTSVIAQKRTPPGRILHQVSCAT